jgi:hypothetical protein
MATQTERLIEYLRQHGSIDPMTAWAELGIYRLGARIWDLKVAGHKIVSGTKKVKNRYDEECRVALYTLEGGAA